jgi:hypothetical protein
MYKVALHQPNFIPYLGFFDKLKSVDVFVIRDEVLFVKNDFHQRNKIRINGNDNLNNPQFKWIHVPVIKMDDYIKFIPINEDGQWKSKLLHDIKVNYVSSSYFNKFYPELEKIFLDDNQKLIDLNMKLIKFLAKSFGINTKIIFASELGLKPQHYEKSNASQDIINICKALNAKTYLSGEGGKNYLDLDLFKKYDIEVEFQNYTQPIYDQKFPGFLPYMSAIDVLFCIGEIPNQDENGIYNWGVSQGEFT